MKKMSCFVLAYFVDETFLSRWKYFPRLGKTKRRIYQGDGSLSWTILFFRQFVQGVRTGKMVATSRTEFSAVFDGLREVWHPLHCVDQEVTLEIEEINEHVGKLVKMELVIRNKSSSSRSYEDTSLIPDTYLRQKMTKIIPPNVNFELI